VRSYGVPMILLGGGGYTMRNVARCWAYETSVALGIEIENDIPSHEFETYYKPDGKIHLPCSNMQNFNSREHSEEAIKRIFENLKHVQAVTVDPSNYKLHSIPPRHLDMDHSMN